MIIVPVPSVGLTSALYTLLLCCIGGVFLCLRKKAPTPAPEAEELSQLLLTRDVDTSLNEYSNDPKYDPVLVSRAKPFPLFLDGVLSLLAAAAPTITACQYQASLIFQLKHRYAEGVMTTPSPYDFWNVLLTVYANFTVLVAPLLSVLFILAIWDSVCKKYISYFLLQNGVLVPFDKVEKKSQFVWYIMALVIISSFLFVLFSSNHEVPVIPFLLTMLTLFKLLSGSFNLCGSLIPLTVFISGDDIEDRLQFLSRCKVVDERTLFSGFQSMRAREKLRYCIAHDESHDFDYAPAPPRVTCDMCTVIDLAEKNSARKSQFWALKAFMFLPEVALREADRKAGSLFLTGFVLSIAFILYLALSLVNYSVAT